MLKFIPTSMYAFVVWLHIMVKFYKELESCSRYLSRRIFSIQETRKGIWQIPFLMLLKMLCDGRKFLDFLKRKIKREVMKND